MIDSVAVECTVDDVPKSFLPDFVRHSLYCGLYVNVLSIFECIYISFGTFLADGFHISGDTILLVVQDVPLGVVLDSVGGVTEGDKITSGHSLFLLVFP